ncbi:uncharacterized protein [Procambarus clarkii]|uniref:uncharacterized protein n=1 Tax=Procambarus clarkii TaxID=6728 RepID=UPI001E6733C0|nr:uncharacterized protein LOC123762103 [Procambarus clarkii]
MASVVHVIVLAGNSFWDVLSVTQNTARAHNRNKSWWIFGDHCNDKESKHAGMSVCICSLSCFPDYWRDFVGIECINKGMKGLRIKKTFKRIPQLKCQSEGLHFAVFLKELLNSDKYKFSVFQQWILKFKQKYSNNISSECNEHLIIWWTLKDQIPYIIDDKWCFRMNRCAQEWQHLDSIMSWLSTLGGACSALGDYNTHFADRAWAISLKQMDIALRLGDPNIISRCRLYAAIALIQQCKFKLAAVVIKTEYQWVKSLPEEVRDQRLVNMCHGIWTKLQHEHKLYHMKIK